MIILVVTDCILEVFLYPAFFCARVGAAVVEYICFAIFAAPTEFTSANVLLRADVFAGTSVLARVGLAVVDVFVAVFTGPTSGTCAFVHVCSQRDFGELVIGI